MTRRSGEDYSTKIDLYTLEYFQTTNTKYSKLEAFYHLLKEFYSPRFNDMDYQNPYQDFKETFDYVKLQQLWKWDDLEVMIFLQSLAYRRIITIHEVPYPKIDLRLNPDWETEIKTNR